MKSKALKVSKEEVKEIQVLEREIPQIFQKVEDFLHNKTINSLDDILHLLTAEILRRCNMDNLQERLIAFHTVFQLRKLEIEKERLMLAKERMKHPQKHIVELRAMPVVDFKDSENEEAKA